MVRTWGTRAKKWNQAAIGDFESRANVKTPSRTSPRCAAINFCVNEKRITMRKIAQIFCLVICLSGCAPTESMIQTAIAQTQMANPTITSSPTPKNTNTPISTNTPRATNTITLTNTPHPTKTPEYGTRLNPYPIGDEILFWQEIDGTKMDFSITIGDVIRGEDAWAAIYMANQFNDPPPQNMEFVLVQLIVDHYGNDAGAIRIDEGDFVIVTNGQVFRHFDISVCCIDDAGFPELDLTLFSGAKAEGWIAVQVYNDDTQPLLALWLERDGTGGYFFSIYP